MEDTLIAELIDLDSTISNFTQITNFGGYEDNPAYSHVTSLLYSAFSEQHVEFDDGRPKYFVVYQLIISVGSAKDPEIDRGFAVCQNGKISIGDCNFHCDYFHCHPSDIKVVECLDKNCGLHNKGIWCLNCNGEFKYASQLGKFMHESIKLSSVPRHSVVYVEKIKEAIDESNFESMANVKKFLDSDKKKISILQSSIRGTEDKIRKITDKLLGEKSYKQSVLDKMLAYRGGNLDAYIKMIMDFDVKLESLKEDG